MLFWRNALKTVSRQTLKLFLFPEGLNRYNASNQPLLDDIRNTRQSGHSRGIELLFHSVHSSFRAAPEPEDNERRGFNFDE